MLKKINKTESLAKLLLEALSLFLLIKGSSKPLFC